MSKHAVFQEYGRYYDLLYRDKDYAGEVDYIRLLLERFGGRPETVLELGCGTGRHGRLLAHTPLQIVGIEVSQEMLTVALREGSASPAAGRGRFVPQLGDVRTVRLGQSFDTVISLFHVVSYMIADEDVDAIFETASVHLRPGGVFLFDVWYTPAVYWVRPETRLKRMADDNLQVARIAESTIEPERNVVQVDYTLFIRDAEGLRELQERHTMRHFTTPELRRIVGQHGLELVHSEEWLTGRPPGLDTWGVCHVARKT